MTLLWVAQAVPDTMEVALSLSGAILNHLFCMTRKTGCNHIVDLVECWCVLSCAANCEEKGWLARQTGTMQAYEKGFFCFDSSEIKLYMRSVIFLTNAITF